MAIPVPSSTGADTYHTVRLNAAWSDLDSDQKRAALTRANDFIRSNFVFDTDVVGTESAILDGVRRVRLGMDGSARGLPAAASER